MKSPAERARTLNEERVRQGFAPVDPKVAETFFTAFGGCTLGHTLLADRLRWIQRKVSGVGRRLRWLVIGR